MQVLLGKRKEDSWSLKRCLEETTPFGDAVNLLPIAVGVVGEMGEVFEAEDNLLFLPSEMTDPTGKAKEKFRELLAYELADVLVYLVLYVRHTDCGWGGWNPDTPISELAVGMSDTASHHELGRALTKSACKLLEHEKKVNRGSIKRDLQVVSAYVWATLTSLIALSQYWNINLEESFRTVTFRNRERNAAGHYGPSRVT
jgi:NTP pyrophosphatase (non-canonical NTP hydrolase)